MQTNNQATMEELQWKDIRDQVAKKNAELARIIDELNPTAEYTIFKASYPFGCEILKNGLLHVPNNKSELVPLTSNEIPERIKHKLNYNNNTNPVSLILNNSAEFFIVLASNTIPLYGLIPPGKVFGTWRVLNPTGTHSPAFIWNMTAGARSIFMLPKISETAGYNKLRRAFQLHAEKPKSLLDHWKIFKEIAVHPDFGETWSVEILYFTRRWFEQLNDKKWHDFKMYLLDKAWQSSEFFRNQFIWDLAFSLIQRQRNIKPNPYIADTVKHLLAMGIGALPGFAAALDDSAAPVRRLQDVFTSIYQLQDYAPIIMQPQFFTLEHARPIYYSLQYPTTIEFSPKSREGSTKIFDLYEIKSLLTKYITDIHSDALNVSGTPLYDLPEKVQYDFFHTDIENYTGIRLSKDISVEDATFTQVPAGMSNNFPANSTFIRGCVRITAKTK